MTGQCLLRIGLRHRAMGAALVAALLGVALLGACAQSPPRRAGPGVSVVVLPKLPGLPDGHVGAVMVRPLDGGDAVLLDKPYVEATLRDTKTVRTSRVDPKSVDDAFGSALAALPTGPTTVLVYFVEGTEELNPEAKRAIDRVVAEMAARSVPEISVVGHTDFVGTDAYNDDLSLKRALRVRDLLVRRGVPAKIIQAIGRGKREPVVRTTDSAVEPRNRRVEIIVR